MFGDVTSAAVSRVVRRPTDAEFLAVFHDVEVAHVVTVPNAATDTWHALALTDDRVGRMRVTTTTHEGNLVGIAAGSWFGSGRPSVIHFENSGLPNAADGLISFASSEVFGIPLLAFVTLRGVGADATSEPLRAIGTRTAEFCNMIFGREHVHGRPDGGGLLMATRSAWREVLTGRTAAVVVPDGAFSRTATLPAAEAADPYPLQDPFALRLTKGVDSLPGGLRAELDATPQRRMARDAAIAAIVAAHPNAAILFSSGYTARAAQAVADRPGNFYNAGYMGGTLAVGWGLATERPDVEVVVVDGDQNSAMSTMPRHLAADYPPNLSWYVLDNGVGASAGSAPTPPDNGLYDHLARVVATIADAPDEFAYPEISTTGVYAAYAYGQPVNSLAGLARGFRRWIDDQS